MEDKEMLRIEVVIMAASLGEKTPNKSRLRETKNILFDVDF